MQPQDKKSSRAAIDRAAAWNREHQTGKFWKRVGGYIADSKECA